MSGLRASSLTAILMLSAMPVALAQEYTEAELQQAREFIETQLAAEKRDRLKELAVKAGLSPEVLFLDVSKLTDDNTLGTGSKKPNLPVIDGPVIGVPGGKPNIPNPDGSGASNSNAPSNGTTTGAGGTKP